MQLIRSSVVLSRLVLIWFAMFVGIATASPFLHTSNSFSLICSGSGGFKLASSDNGGDANSNLQHKLDCPLCMPAMMSGPGFEAQHQPCEPVAELKPVFSLVHVAYATTAPPLPSRGPPAVR